MLLLKRRWHILAAYDITFILCAYLHNFKLTLPGLIDSRDACAYCDEKIVKQYIDEDPNVLGMTTVNGETCLMLTAVKNCVSIAELMIELGADVNAVNEHPNVSILCKLWFFFLVIITS